MIDKKLAKSFFPRALQSFEEFFKQEAYPYFLGGSRRFGYNRARSDLDMFVFADDHGYDTLIEELFSMGFQRDSHDDHYPEETFACGSLFHIVVFRERSTWEATRDEHIMVDKFLSQHSMFIKWAKLARMKGISGKMTFHILSDMAKQS